MELAEKIVLITGGGTGIGRATALAAARQGARIVIGYAHSETEAHQTAADVVAAGGQALTLKADVADEAQVKALIAATLQHWGGIDVLVNSAGTTVFADLADLEAIADAAWDRLFQVNVKGVWYCCRAAAPTLKQRRGAIVTIASIAGFTGLGSSIPYSVTKGAVLTLTKSLARALAPEVRVNGIAPGFVDTRWHAARPNAAATMAERLPLKKVATAEDVAELALYLASAPVVTGQNYIIDAGATL
jgi:3-oxoacyl-[acyl-carrier protein] reductase